MIQEMLNKVDLKRLAALPALVLLASLVIVAHTAASGTLPMSIEFRGGTLITAYGVPSIDLESALEEKFGFTDVRVRSIMSATGAVTGSTIEINENLIAEEKERVRGFLISLGVDEEKIIIRNVTPSLGESFLNFAVKAVIAAFAFMGIVVFIRFRKEKTIVPSFAIVLSAFSDIVITLAIMILLGIQLSPSSFIALLLLIGYSVDTDILLTTRVLVRKATGDFQERLLRAMKTGMTMVATTFTAVLLLYLTSTSPALKEIAAVILIGILIDVMNTWVQNAAILQWYLERA